MIEIIRKGFGLKKLVFLASLALLSQGFCMYTYAGTINGISADTSIVAENTVAGNTGILSGDKGSRVVANNAPRFTLNGAENLLTSDKFENGIETNSDLSKTSIPKTENASNDGSHYNETVHYAYSDAISEIEFKNTTLLDGETTSGSAINADSKDADTDEILTSGSSAEVVADNTNSETTESNEDTDGEKTSIDEETQTTTEEGKSSRKGSFGGGKSSRKADRSNDSDKNDSSKKEDEKPNKPDNRDTDTPATPQNESNNDNENKSSNDEPTPNNDNNKDKFNKSEDENADDKNKDGKNDVFEPPENDDKGGTQAQEPYDDSLQNTPNTSPESSYLPQTGSPIDTLSVTLCGFAFIAFGAILINKTKKTR